METMIRVMTPVLVDRRVQTLVAVLAVLVASLLLGPNEAAAWSKHGT